MQPALKRLLPILFIVCSISCDESGVADATFLQMLINERGWIVEEVRQDHNQASTFEGMVLTFSPTGYTTKGSTSDVWPGVGEYYLENPSSRILVRDDQNELLISELDADHLVIVLDFKTFEPIIGRTRSVLYSFTFSNHQ